MDGKVFAAAFAAVFVAELADKTQLVGITMASKSGRPLAVWCGSVAAYLIVTAISVFLGALFAKYLRPEWVRSVGALLFIVLGILMFFEKI